MTSPESELGFNPANLHPLEGSPGSMPPWELKHRIRKLFEAHKTPRTGAMGYDWAAQAGGVVVVLMSDGLLRADLPDIKTSILRHNTGYFWGEDYKTGDLCVCDIALFFEALRRLRLLQVLDDIASL